MADDTLEIVATFLTRVDADLACGALRAAGIDATITDDDGGGTNPELWMNGVRVQVRAEDAATAKAVLGSDASAPPRE
jgi:hypothetical protein